MAWQVDDYVTHKVKPEWGVGKVFKSNSQDFDVFFVHAGKRTFMQPAQQLERASDDLIGHPLLNFVAPSILFDKGIFRPLPDCIHHFHKLFPDGFYDPRYLSDKVEGERPYKVQARDLARSLLNKTDWQALNDSGQYAEICQRLAKVESRTNLLHSFEKIKWHAALKDSTHQQDVAEALFQDLYGLGPRANRFNVLAKVLEKLDGCAKWTIATYYGFLLQPESEPRIFIKPEVTKYLAEACGWDLQYDSSLNWNTLTRAEGLAKYLFEELTRANLRPRDMIDIQSFIWCIDPKSYA